MTEAFQWVKTDAALVEACRQWNQARVVTVDTEFVRTETYYAKLGLIQVGLNGSVWLIDPLVIEDWTPLVKLLENPEVVKVFHSLSEDAEVLLNSTGALVAPVFDTQIAASLLGHDLQIGFARLVEAELGVCLPKEVTRSDWLKRPLAVEQCEYAVADVYWLERIYHRFAERLIALDRYDWVLEDSNRVARDSLPSDPALYYFKLRGAWKLKGSRLLCLQRLAQWREVEARTRDVNRSRVISDAEIIQVAQAMPQNQGALARLKGLHPRKIRHFGAAIVDIVITAEASSREEWPERLPGPLPADQAELFRGVKSQIAMIADKTDVPAEILARRKQLEQLVRSGCYTGEYRMPAMLSGWRHELVAEPLMQFLAEQRNDTDD